jgi:hypothetical protein
MARRLHQHRSGSEEGRRFPSINTMVRLILRGKAGRANAQRPATTHLLEQKPISGVSCSRRPAQSRPRSERPIFRATAMRVGQSGRDSSGRPPSTKPMHRIYVRISRQRLKSDRLLVGAHASTILPPGKIAPKCDLPHIPSKLPSHTFSSPTPGGLPAPAPPCYSMRAHTKKLGNKGLSIVHSWPEIRICVKDHCLLTQGRGWSLPPKPRYSWVRLEQFCWVMVLGGASSSA